MQIEGAPTAGALGDCVGRRVTHADARSAHLLAQCAGGAVAGALALGAATIWYRLLAGALGQALDGSGVVVAAAMVGALAAGARLAWRFASPGQADLRSRARWAHAAVCASVLGWGAALSMVNAPAGAVVALWVILGAEEVWAWRGDVGLSRLAVLLQQRGEGRRETGEGIAASLRRQVSGLQSPIPSPQPPASSLQPPAGDVVQQFVRRRAADGGERLSGWVRVALAPGQRSASVHLAFCPPFGRLPRVAVVQQEGPNARIKEAQLLPHGVRLDLKLGQPAETPTSLLLQITAQAEAASNDSATNGE